MSFWLGVLIGIGASVVAVAVGVWVGGILAEREFHTDGR